MKEVNDELEILRLERTIHLLKAKQATSNLRKSLTFSSILSNVIQSVFKK